MDKTLTPTPMDYPNVIMFTYQLLLFSIGYNVSYSDDKKFGKSGYHVSSSVEKIATEIMTHGPVEGAFTVYADFPSYKSGKYYGNVTLCTLWTFSLLMLMLCFLSFDILLQLFLTKFTQFIHQSSLRCPY